MTVVTHTGPIGYDFNWDLVAFAGAVVDTFDASTVVMTYDGGSLTLEGSFLSFDGNNRPDSGGIDTITITVGGESTTIETSILVADFFAYVDGNDSAGLLNALLSGDDIIFGSAGNDHLIGLSGNDTIYSGGGLDSLDGGADDDRLIIDGPVVNGSSFVGGDGTDTLEVRNLPGSTNGGNGIPTTGFFFNLGGSTISGIEVLEFNSDSDKALNVGIFYGVGGAIVYNGPGSLVGGDGNDALLLLVSGGGTYQMPVPALSNWTTPEKAYVAGTGDAVALVAIGDALASYTLIASGEDIGLQVLVGLNGDDVLVGSNGMDVLNGNGGANELLGYGGNDALVIGNVAGSTLYTGAGSLFDGGDGIDFLSVGGHVNFQGTLFNIEGIYLQPEVVPTAQTGGQDPAVLELSGGTLATLPSDLILDGEGTIVVHLDTETQVSYGADRVDDATAPLVVEGDEDADVLGVTSLPGGGFAVYWEADTDGDRNTDAIAVQRYGADGAKDGAITTLDVSQQVADYGDRIVDYELTALDGGGYALTYGLVLETFGSYVSVNAGPAGGSVRIPLTGLPTDIYVASVPGTASLAITGFDNEGAPLSVPVSVVDGNILIDQALLDQFGVDNRLALEVSNLNASELVEVYYSVEADVSYDPTSALQDISVSGDAFLFNGLQIAALAHADGRVEAFHVDSVTFDSIPETPQGFVLTISTTQYPQSIDISGIPGAVYTPTGITIQGVVPDGNGDIFVPQAILDQLGGYDAAISLIALGVEPGSSLTGTVSYREGEALPEGVYVETFDGAGVLVGDGPVRVDDVTAPFVSEGDEDADALGVMSLSDGGFAVHWEADTDGDGETDAIAVQRYGSDGTMDGAVTTLDLSQQIADYGERIIDYELTALDGGGYALTYGLYLEESGKYVSVNAGPAGGAVRIALTGLPSEITVLNVPGTASLAITGFDNEGALLSVPVSIVDGQILIDQALLDQFGVDNRLTLEVSNLNAGEPVEINYNANEDVNYDPTSALQDISVSGDAFLFNGLQLAVLGHAEGRVEAFHVDSITFDSIPETPQGFILTISTTQYPLSIDISGIPGAVYTPTGIQISGVVPDGNGDIVVPQSILDQLGVHDASISLIALGVEPGTSLTGTVSYREGEALLEGVFVETFDSAGSLVGDGPVRVDDVTAPLVGDVDEDQDVLGVSPLSDGGFAVHWEADTDGDGDTDTIAVQRYGADGMKVGGIEMLQFSHQITDNGDEIADYDLTALDDGSYALTYAIAAPTVFKDVYAVPNTQPFSAFIVGEPVTITFFQAPAGAVYTLNGTGNDGLPNSVLLNLVDGEIVITQDILDQFSVDDRFGFTISGFAAGSDIGFRIEVKQTVSYDSFSALQEFAVNSDAELAPNGTASATLYHTAGRTEAFHIDSVTFDSNPSTPEAFLLLINTVGSPYAIDISGIAGASYSESGINIFGVVPDSNGDILVPQQILDQLGGQDAFIVLVAIGLEAGSTVSGSVSYREGEVRPEGLFVETYDSVSFDGSQFTYEPGSNVYFDIRGTEGDDIFVLPTGDSIVEGDAGNDLVAFAGNRGDYAASANGANSVQVGGYILNDVELYQFADGTFTWDGAQFQQAANSGIVADGYVAGATVYIDVDGDNVFDVDEPWTTTDDNGNFFINSQLSGTLRAFGGTNIDTGLPNDIVLSAPDGATVINPLTTLITSLVEDSVASGTPISAGDAEAQVKTAFGLDASLDLTQLDLIEAAASDPDALAAQKAAAGIAEVLDAVADAGGDTEGALDALTGIVKTGQTVDLTNNATLVAVVSAGGLSGDTLDEVVAETQVVNQTIAAATDVGGISEAQGTSLVINGTEVGDDLDGGAFDDVIFGKGGSDVIHGFAGHDQLYGGEAGDMLDGGLGDDYLNGGSNVDTAVVTGNRADYTVTQTWLGVFEVSGPDGTDTLENMEYLQFADELLRLLPGEGVSVDFNADPATYMAGIRDFDGNDLGGLDGWLRIGEADVDGDGDLDQILVNSEIGRWAEVGVEDDGLVYFDDHGWAGDTRVVGIYIDPLVQSGEVVAGSDFDSQQRLQYDLENNVIDEVLGYGDYNGDGLQEIYFAQSNGLAYLHAYMHADGNIQYANYQTEEQVIEYLSSYGYGEETYGDWFPAVPVAQAQEVLAPDFIV